MKSEEPTHLVRRGQADWHTAPGFGHLIGFDWSADTGELLKQSKGRRIHRVITPQTGPVIVKRHFPRDWKEPIKYLFKPTRAMAEWHNSHRLSAAGISVARPLAVGEQRRLGLWRGSLLIVTAIEPSTSLIDYIEGDPPVRQGHRLARVLAELIARLHNAGFQHHDLHGWNILLQQAAGNPPSPHLVDLNEVRQPRRLTADHCIEDLARLSMFAAIGQPSRLWFLSCYLRARDGRDAPSRKQWRRWARAIDQRARKLWRGYRGRRGHNPYSD